MIAPLVPYAIRGAIWYQGESNAGRAYQYRTLFPAMIASWREAWNQGEFPFLFVQLAPYMKIESEPTESAWAELREAQLFTMLNCPNTAMAVITDVGEENDIHPEKEAAGGRSSGDCGAVHWPTVKTSNTQVRSTIAWRFKVTKPCFISPMLTADSSARATS
jgi:hypothetical protein